MRQDRLSGAADSFNRRSGSGTGAGLHGDLLRHRSSDDVPSSKDVVSNLNFFCPYCLQKWYIHMYVYTWCHHLCTFFQQADSERRPSRNGSSSKRALMPNSRPSSSGEHNENRASRLSSGNNTATTRLSSTHQRTTQPGFESKSSSFTRIPATRGTGGGGHHRDETLRSFELLTIGSGKRKWETLTEFD